MRAEAWMALAEILLSLGALAAGLWAVFTFNRSRRTDAARWTIDLFNEFYRDPTILEAREVYEYCYWSRTRLVVEMRVADRDLELSEEERGALRDVDLVLNCLEQLLYLESEAQITLRDRTVFFDYWFGILEYPSRAGLRRYLRNCGYERCADALSIQEHEMVLVDQVLEASPLVRMGDSKSSVYLPARLATNGLLEVSDDLPMSRFDSVDLRDPKSLRGLDLQHGYSAKDHKQSACHRVSLPSADGVIDIWAYVDERTLSQLPSVLPEAGGGFSVPAELV